MRETSNLVLKTHHSISEIDPFQWDTLTDGTPLLSHAFLYALESSASVGSNSGWMPCHLALHDSSTLIGALPLYLKTHSYGEYVFDWAWADAYARYQRAYYPKLVSAIPFSPVTSRRLLCTTPQSATYLIAGIEEMMKLHRLSSAHILFPDEKDAATFGNLDWIKRDGVQFRWVNRGYDSFDSFLMALNHDKRKKIKQERKRLESHQLRYQWLTGNGITTADWDFFYDCYVQTYHEHHATPYLTRHFFDQINETLSNQILLIMASDIHGPMASSLCFYNGSTLYGRYWGALRYIPGLHFELCYYQPQSFCIAKGIQFFEGGAQGEHKLARGFEPRSTSSFHRIADPDFEQAIRNAAQTESGHMHSYTDELVERSPFK